MLGGREGGRVENEGKPEARSMLCPISVRILLNLRKVCYPFLGDTLLDAFHLQL
jgi:hypothetical protein